MAEENPYQSQKKTAQTLSLHHNIVKRWITEELNLRRVKVRWVLHTLTASQKLERDKISRKLSGHLTQFQVTDLARIITGNETGVYFENTRSAIWVMLV
jgi:uncharacterized protein YacL (UPF0231 family)